MPEQRQEARSAAHTSPHDHPWERVADRVLGARIVEAKLHGNALDRIVLSFEHRGTDDDSGYLTVDLADVHFGDDLA